MGQRLKNTQHMSARNRMDMIPLWNSNDAICIPEDISETHRKMPCIYDILLVIYLNEFYALTVRFELCLQAYNCLIGLLSSLGFSINWIKVTDLMQQLVFLRVLINTVTGGAYPLNQGKYMNCVKRFTPFSIGNGCWDAKKRKMSSVANFIPRDTRHLCILFSAVSKPTDSLH